MITIILIEPENPGNTGAILRSMKNFDFTDIIIVNPSFDTNSEELLDRAKWAKNLINNIRVYPYDMNKLRKEFDYLIATTAKIGRDYNILRSPITPEELAEKIIEINNNKKNNKTKIGLLIGREGIGLKNEEISVTDFTVTIPTSKKYGTMNVSHATTIILYEIFKKQKSENIISHITPISNAEKEQILKIIDEKLKNMYFATEEKRNTQRILWKKILGKAMLSKREAYALIGFLKKIK
ncbi:MAG: RNA methyltransferase [Candidatus Woesearchaeota archaeon]|nr:MAG: RNA methyltransferase [Candidatus Woesearchaeota archaeon]